MAEELKLKNERRNQIHTLIQNSLSSMLQEKVTDILNSQKSDFEKIKAINAAIDETNEISERYDRFLHGGKTESEIRKERIKRDKAQFDQYNKVLDDIFKTNGPLNI